MTYYSVSSLFLGRLKPNYETIVFKVTSSVYNYHIFIYKSYLLQLKPDWLVFEIFTLNEMGQALQKDALQSSPSVSRKVIKPNKEIFDVITYHKGNI